MECNNTCDKLPDMQNESLTKTDEKSTNFPVYIIYSPLSLYEISEIISKFEKGVALRVDRFMGAETNRTIALMDHSTVEKISSAGYSMNSHPELHCVKFKVTPQMLPKEGENPLLFIPLPRILTPGECRKSILSKISQIIRRGIVPGEAVKVDIPLKSRLEGTHAGWCFIRFREDITIEQRTIVKVLLNDTRWILDFRTLETHKRNVKVQRLLSRHLMKCFWSKSKEVKKVTILKREAS